MESIAGEVNALDKKNLSSFKKVYKKLSLGDFSEATKLDNLSYNIYFSSYKDVNVSFMRLADNYLFILHAYLGEFKLAANDEIFIKEALNDKEKVYDSQVDLRIDLKAAINRSA